jgi:AraC-like DNA-binding protein
VTVIAYECGFADAAHFIRDFKAMYGMTPGQTRASMPAHAKTAESS